MKECTFMKACKQLPGVSRMAENSERFAATSIDYAKIYNNFMEYTKEHGLDYQQAYRARIRAGKQLLKKNIIDKRYLKRGADSILLRTAPA